jgi:murein DD-endopeptidase MepM/ murein hydrolase activator NlpD
MVLILTGFLAACIGKGEHGLSWQLLKATEIREATATVVPVTSTPPHPLLTYLPPAPRPGEPYLTPTPDNPHEAPIIRTESEHYIVQPGDSLSLIAYRFGVSPQLIIDANGIANPNYLAVWQRLLIPAPILREPGPNYKIIPDSELVYGPAGALFDLHHVITGWGGFLEQFREQVKERELSGADVIQLVANRYSVNPRLLLALLEYQSGWLTNTDVPPESLTYPMGYLHEDWQGLFGQLSFVANELNRGYYLWRAGWLGPFVFTDGSVVVPGQGVNAGTVGVQHLFSHLYRYEQWRNAVGEQGFNQTYRSLFGDPFGVAVEPLLPDALEQPTMQLPFEVGKTWSFTSGPHSAWNTGAGWAALDFAPPGYAYGCVLSNEWVVASADGVVLRTDEGVVVLDLDGDGYEQTGWVVLYLHVEERDRVPLGAILHTGDRIGHPSCEGGISTGTHLHIARKYNGEWIPADGPIPFIMDGWVSGGQGREYNGTLSRGSVIIEAYFRRGPYNQISR